MTKADQNLAVIQNFILHITHCSDSTIEENFKTPIAFTPDELYEMANSYIDEDHADGRQNSENNIEL